MEERYHATTQNRFYPDMSNVNKIITVEAKLMAHLRTIFVFSSKNMYIKMKIIHYRPWEFLEFEVVKFSSLTTGRFYPQVNIPGTDFFYRFSRSEGHSAIGRPRQRKFPMRIEPATFRLVAQCLNRLRHRVSANNLHITTNFIKARNTSPGGKSDNKGHGLILGGSTGQVWHSNED